MDIVSPKQSPFGHFQQREGSSRHLLQKYCENYIPPSLAVLCSLHSQNFTQDWNHNFDNLESTLEIIGRCGIGFSPKGHLLFIIMLKLLEIFICLSVSVANSGVLLAKMFHVLRSFWWYWIVFVSFQCEIHSGDKELSDVLYIERKMIFILM